MKCRLEVRKLEIEIAKSKTSQERLHRHPLFCQRPGAGHALGDGVKYLARTDAPEAQRPRKPRRTAAAGKFSVRAIVAGRRGDEMLQSIERPRFTRAGRAERRGEIRQRARLRIAAGGCGLFYGLRHG